MALASVGSRGSAEADWGAMPILGYALAAIVFVTGVALIVSDVRRRYGKLPADRQGRCDPTWLGDEVEEWLKDRQQPGKR